MKINVYHLDDWTLVFKDGEAIFEDHEPGSDFWIKLLRDAGVTANSYYVGDDPVYCAAISSQWRGFGTLDNFLSLVQDEVENEIAKEQQQIDNSIAQLQDRMKDLQERRDELERERTK